jgi:HD-GYP domain-containing protein (c-di-GMP phosphodiesterase class II)
MSRMSSVQNAQNHLERTRDEIVWRIISDGVLEGQQTLAVGVVAEEFFDRLLIALERGSYLDMITWVDRICESYRDFPQIGSMLASGCRAVIAQLSDLEAGAGEVVSSLGALEQSICAVAFKPRSLLLKPEAPLDEIDVLVRGLIEQLEQADALSAEHSHAVSAWCERLGRRLSLSETEVAYVGRCGLLHDVGKIKVAGEILQAPRALTEAEWVVMRSHALASEELVSAIRPLRSLAPAVRSHHERLDGRGYPDGLVGSQISLTTRIVSVADAFNAMIGRRPYRLPMSPGNALDRLVQERGRQFDPIVVEAMISVVNQT